MKAALMLKRNAIIALTAVFLLCAAVAGRHVLEERMLTHVLVQMPLLVAGGALLMYLHPPTPVGREPGLYRFWNSCDAYGMTSMLVILFCCIYWMMPNAIGHAVANPFAEIIKFISLMFAGALLPGALRKSGTTLQIVFTGTLTLMLAVVGLIYLLAPQRLCNSYLLDDQVHTGIGLMIMASVMPVWWCVAMRYRRLEKRNPVTMHTRPQSTGVS